MTEAEIQALDVLAAAQQGYTLLRNNSGALRDEHGRLVRFGLGNVSAAVNERFKSSDYVGWRSVLITPAHVGQMLAVFAAREYKPSGWKLTPGDKRAQAQARFGALVTAAGGDFRFVSEAP